MGGLPAYLLTKEGIKLRTYDTQYLQALDRWWDKLLTAASPYSYNTHSGP